MNDLTGQCCLLVYYSSSLTVSQMREEQVLSPMMKAEKRLEKSSTHSSPSKHRIRHHHSHSDKTRHRSKPHSADHNIATTGSAVSTHLTDLNSDKELSPQPLSDATQSSDNSTRDYSSKHRHKPSNRKSTHRLSAEQNVTTSQSQTFGKDDLVSAYSPIVDRQRHSSSASSSGQAVIKSVGSSPSRQSVERPYGYHHVGASVSPSRRTQQWAVLSPFNRTPESIKRDKEKGSQTAVTAAMKTLNFSLHKSAPNSPQL